MRLLAIDTASHICSVALMIDGEILLEEADLPQGHSDIVLEMADRLLRRGGLASPRELDGVAFGRGPGSFTGLRIAAGVTQGIAYGGNLPVAPVSNLAALALRAMNDLGATKILPALDARMGEVYWAGYQSSGDASLQLSMEEEVRAPGLVATPQDAGWIGVGEGWRGYGETLRERCGDYLERVEENLNGSAREIALLAAPILANGLGLAPQQALPVYLRNDVARKPGKNPLR